MRQILKSLIISMVTLALLVIFSTSPRHFFSLENCVDSAVNFQWIFWQVVILPGLTFILVTLKDKIALNKINYTLNHQFMETHLAGRYQWWENGFYTTFSKEAFDGKNQRAVCYSRRSS